MKNVIIAAVLAIFSTSAVANVMDTGTAEFGGSVSKVCDVYGFAKGRVVIREGSDTNTFTSDAVGGIPATFLVRANARNSILTFGAPSITFLSRDDGVTTWFPEFRVVTYSGFVRAQKNNRISMIANGQVPTTSVGTNNVTLHINITDTNGGSMIPAGTYDIDVPVTCTKSTTPVN